MGSWYLAAQIIGDQDKHPRICHNQPNKNATAVISASFDSDLHLIQFIAKAASIPLV